MVRNILFIGGTKFIGTNLINRFLETGDNIYVFSRSAPRQDSVTYLTGDRNDPQSLARLKEFIAGKQFDCIYDMCCYEPKQAKSLYPIIKDHTKRLVLFSSAAAYAKTNFFPLNEIQSPLGEHASFGDYGTNKAAIESIYTDACAKDNVQLSIFRPHYILGAGDYFKRHHYYFSRLEAGTAFQLPGNGQGLIQFAYAGDVAELFLKVPFSQDGKIEILNIASNTQLSLEGTIELFARRVSTTTHIEHVAYELHGLREDAFYDELFPFPNLNLVLDITRMKTIYGITPTEPEVYLDELYADWQATKSTYEGFPNKF